MQTGVYSAQKKDGTVYYRANITYQTKHISLGSFSSEEDAHSAYLEACNLLENEAVTLFNIHSQIRHLSFDKAVCLLITLFICAKATSVIFFPMIWN